MSMCVRACVCPMRSHATTNPGVVVSATNVAKGLVLAARCTRVVWDETGGLRVRNLHPSVTGAAREVRVRLLECSAATLVVKPAKHDAAQRGAACADAELVRAANAMHDNEVRTSGGQIGQ